MQQNNSVTTSRWKRWLLIALLTALAFAAGLILSIAIYGPQRVMSTPLGRTIEQTVMPLISKNDRYLVALPANQAFPKDWIFHDLNGNQKTLPGAGQIRLINYWASWCGPCIHEMPLLDKYAQSQNKVMVIGIALEPYQDAKRFADKQALGFALLSETPKLGDSSAVLGNANGVLPYSVLIDGEGYLLAKHTGPFADQQEIEQWVEDAL